MSLKEYRRKRDFKVTTEPAASQRKSAAGKRRFVIQKHAARRLHFDFRLELGRTLVSWAVPKGMPLKAGEKRLAVKVEDHPLSYIDFEGTIPQGEYGAGTVQVWDQGNFEPLSRSPLKDLEAGKLHFVLHGEKLSGEWYLVRMGEGNQWLIIRAGENHRKLSRKEADSSSASGRTMNEIEQGAGNGTSLHPQPSTPLSMAEVTFIEPMKARLIQSPPAGDWLYEVKFDGFRALAYKQGDRTALISRTAHDLSSRFSELTAALSTINAKQCVIDGEITALDREGRSSFQLLQRYELGEIRPPICYYAFDLLMLNGQDLSRWPIEKRKEKLKSLLSEESDVIRFSTSLGSDAKRLLQKISQLRLEGLIGKRTGSHYEAGRRSGTWIKLKVLEEQEFVIGGYTEPEGARPFFGAILVGYFEGQKLRYAGKVGTGFSEALLKDLHQRFQGIAQEDCPFANLPEERSGRYGQGITASAMKQCHWLKPELVAQVRFSEWTGGGRLRQPVFIGLRTDKPAKKVIRETRAEMP